MSAKKEKRSGAFGALLGMLGLSGVAGLLVAIMVTPAIAVTGMTANNSIGIFNELPEYATLGDDLAQRVTLYGLQDGQQVPFATIFETNREEVGWDQISQYAKDAAVYGEDARFYEHGGVDVQSVARALVGNLASGEVESGGSTLTMQLIKNINVEAANRLTDPDERSAAYKEATRQTMDRKLKEMKLAIGLEKEYDKQTILLSYLNIAHFGGVTYGIEAAAQRYFGITSAELSPAQAASLIAMVQAPNARSLDKEENFENNRVRRDYVLNQMFKYEALTQEEFDAAIATPIQPNLQPLQTGCMSATTGQYFCDAVVKELQAHEAFGATPEERKAAFRNGYDVYTTIDLNMQNHAQATMVKWVPETDPRFHLGGAAVGIEPGTGRTLYMTQNTRFDDTRDGGGPGTTSVNYNTDFDRGGSSGFQAGSTFKIFTLAQWLKAGHGLNEHVSGTPRTWKQNEFTYCGSKMSGTDYAPKNSGGSAASVSVLSATASSVNAAFLNMARELDLCDIRDTAASLGVHTATGPKDGEDVMSNISDLIGVGEDHVSVSTIAAAFAGIAARGLFCSPILIDRVVKFNGEELAPPASQCTQGIDPEIADAMIHALKGVISGGTGSASRASGAPMFGKTGSTTLYNQTWMGAATTKVASAVWIGNVKGVPGQALNRTNINGTSASNLRHRLTSEMFNVWNDWRGGDNWPAAKSNYLSGRNNPVPDLAGDTPEQAKKVLEGLGFGYADGGPVASAIASGRVAHTDPGAGASAPRGRIVTVYTSDGSLAATMPNVVGKELKQATDELKSAGFDSISVNYRGGQQGGTCMVEASDPGAGAATAKNAAVTLTASCTGQPGQPGQPGTTPPGPPQNG
ncbi:transglycosylase domain-containing protein [Diaminobutyricimonas sp. LJ205]|uniref:transglycosylase domain-containing protein n=1 Tax=Diaminobutyricimonas sp. LJ205 TaxID=2683590 RepID=UPI0012F4AF19|nr:transglycosylase domain-containing protein [Diaminobutyricimonas sp. LJ205]